MTTFLQFAALGLGPGAIYALYSLGIVAIYRASGVLNLAQGGIALVGGAIFYSLNVRTGVAVIPAAVLSVLAAGVIGVVMSAVIMRRLKDSSALFRLIASVAALIIFQAATVLIWGSNVLSVPSFLPTSTVTLGKVAIGADRLILLGIALLLTAVFWIASRRTRIGIATTAVSENRRSLAALGWSPEIVAAGSWMVGAAVAGLAGILIAPISGLAAEETTMLVVPALAVALLANFESFPLTTLAAVLLGIGQSLMAQYVHVDGIAQALPFIVIVVVLVVRGQQLPARGAVVERLAEFGNGLVRPIVVIPATVIAVLLLGYVFDEEVVIAATQSLAFATIFLSVVVLTGYTGQLSLGQMALAGIGALIAGRLVATTGVPFPLAALLGIMGTIVVGAAFAIPALRTRGATLAVITLGVGVAIVSLVFNNLSISGGASGTEVTGQTFFGIEIDPLFHPRAYSLFALGAFIVCALVVTNIRRSRVGRSLIAVRTNERAAAAMGISVTESKIYAFCVSAGVAALGGIVLGFQQSSIVYSNIYGSFQSILLVSFAVIGGIGFVAGTLFGSLFPAGGIGSYAIQEIAGGIFEWIPLIGGVGLLAALMLNPNGVASACAGFGPMIAARFRRKTDPPTRVPELTGRAPRRRVDPATLTVTGLSVSYGATKAVDDVSFSVGPGEVVGLIGPNGAGKTTLIDAISGFVKTRSGSVAINDRELDRMGVHRRARAGIGRSFQSLELFEDISVRENLRAASDRRDLRSYLTVPAVSSRDSMAPAAIAAIEDFSLTTDLEERPSSLSYGRRRLVAVARAVADEPSIVLLDEPAAGLNSEESEELARLVRRLADEWGIGILVVEHDMNFVMGICDKVVVLDFGRQISTGTAAEVRNDPAVISAYLGVEEDEAAAGGLDPLLGVEPTPRSGT